MSYAKRKAKQEMAVEREKEKIRAKEEAKAQRKANAKADREAQASQHAAERAAERKRMLDAMSPDERQEFHRREGRNMLIGLAVVVALIGGCIAIAATSDTPSREERAAADRSTTTTRSSGTRAPTAGRSITAPPISDVDLSAARRTADRAGLNLEPIDLSPDLLGASRQRVIVRSSNWHVLVQCPTPGAAMREGDTIYVGVLKDDEMSVADRVSLATSSLPECP